MKLLAANRLAHYAFKNAVTIKCCFQVNYLYQQIVTKTSWQNYLSKSNVIENSY